MDEVQGTPASKVWVMDFLHRAIESGYINQAETIELTPDEALDVIINNELEENV